MVVLRALYPIACVAGVKRERGRGNLGARERVGYAREKGKEGSPPPSRVGSRPNSLPLPFRTPYTQAIYPTAWTLRPKGKSKTPMHIK